MGQHHCSHLHHFVLNHRLLGTILELAPVLLQIEGRFRYADSQLYSIQSNAMLQN